jgi:integrase
LTPDEETRLLEVCGPEDRVFVLLGLDTLLRLSSVVGLEWAQVKLDQRVVIPLNAKVSTGPKPISTRLRDALVALPRNSRYVLNSFHLKGKGDSAPRNKAIRRFESLCKAADVKTGRAYGGLTYHCLRHTGASRALHAGASVRTVMELGGWRNVATVARYLHATDADVRAAAESIAGHASVTSRKTAS